MIDNDQAFAQFALWALIGAFATMLMGGGLLPLLGVALALSAPELPGHIEAIPPIHPV